VGIFRRGGDDATSKEVDESRIGAPGTETNGTGATRGGTAGDPGAGEPVQQDALQARDPAVSRARGPFDVSEVGDDTSRIDLGALRVPGLAGMELRLELDESQQGVVGATAALAASAVQLQAFAAPRSGGMWHDIRTEIAESIIGQGGTAEVRDGPLGRELLARMPTRGTDGRTVFQPVRFLGVDGPRWFLRAVLSGPAATSEPAAEELLGVVRGTVVVRGSEAMAPRELLPLRLPAELSPPGGDADEAGAANADGGEELRPFERGPEITEVR